MKLQGTKAALAASGLLALLVAVGVACSDDDNPAGDSPRAIPTSAGSRGDLPPANGEANDRDEFINTTLAQIEQIEVQLEEIEAEVETMGGDARASAEARIDAVKAKVAESQADLAQVPMLSEEEYETLQATIEGEIDAAMTETQELAEELGI